MVISRNKSAERKHNLKTDNRFFERMEEFRYLGTILYVMWKHFGLCTADNYRYFLSSLTTSYEIGIPDLM